MTKTKLVVAAFAALTITAGQAVAQEEGEWEGEGEGEVEGEVSGEVSGEGVEAEGSMEVQPPEMEPMEDEGVATGLTTPAGKIRVSAVIGLNLSSDLVAKPFTIAPDVFYGVNDKLEVGLAHTSYAITGFMGGNALGGGLCLAGEENGCAKVYNGPTGLLARFGLMDGATLLAFDGGLVFNTIDPMALGIKLGVRGRHMAGKLAVGFAPNIYIGATERDGGNKEFINVPVEIGFAASDKLMVGLQTGIQGPLDGFGDVFVVPLSIAAAFGVNDNLEVGGAFTLHRVTGGCPVDDCGGAADARGLSLFANWHN